MQKKIILAISGAAFGAGMIALLLWPHGPLTPSTPQTPPVTLRYIEERNADGSLSGNPSFWVTNHTDKALAIFISAVEVRFGSVWSNYAGFSGAPLVFSEEEGKPAALIGPHAADVGSLDHRHITLPKEGPWRVKARASEKLAGVGNPIGVVDRERLMLELRFRYGITNASLNPFSTNISRYGRGREVVSEEILPGSAPEQSVGKPLATQAAAAAPRARPEDIAKAREALRQKMGELLRDEAADQPRVSAPH